MFYTCVFHSTEGIGEADIRGDKRFWGIHGAGWPPSTEACYVYRWNATERTDGGH